jgi:hypothetical protein
MENGKIADLSNLLNQCKKFRVQSWIDGIKYR